MWGFVFLLNSFPSSSSKGCRTEGAQSGGLESSSEPEELQGMSSEGASAGPEEGKLHFVGGRCSVATLWALLLRLWGREGPEKTSPKSCFRGCGALL